MIHRAVAAADPPIFVMAGLDPAIHVFLDCGGKDVDARHKAGHDGVCRNRPA
jgi:hypothetical protein